MAAAHLFAWSCYGMHDCVNGIRGWQEGVMEHCISQTPEGPDRGLIVHPVLCQACLYETWMYTHNCIPTPLDLICSVSTHRVNTTQQAVLHGFVCTPWILMVPTRRPTRRNCSKHAKDMTRPCQRVHKKQWHSKGRPCLYGLKAKGQSSHIAHN